MTIVLTYNAPHRKTHDLLTLLKAQDESDVTVMATDFHYRKTHTPLIKHRLPVVVDILPEEHCRQLGYTFINAMTATTLPSLLKEYDGSILVAGAGILPADVVKTGRVINAHPGWLPDVRGLDALKWAIVENLPLGVTTHILTEEVDGGLLIERQKLTVNPGETFEAFGFRQYQLEIEMLARAPHVVLEKEKLEPLFTQGHPVHRRMPADIEQTLLEKFEALR